MVRATLMHRAPAVACGVVAAMLATTAPLSAQARVEFTPFAGAYMPTAALFPAGTLPNAASAARVRQKPGLALGGRVTAWVTDRFAIDGSYGYSGSGVTQTNYSPSTDPCPEAGCPLVAVTSNTTGHIWMVSARFLFVVGGRPSTTVFYVLGGPAYVVHRGKDLTLYAGDNVLEMTATSPGAVGGIGTSFKVSRTALALRADLEDCLYVTRFSGYDGPHTWSSSQVQSDFLISLGLSVPLSGGNGPRARTEQSQ